MAVGGRVLKAGEARSQTRVPFNYDDIVRQGEDALAAARSEAERILQEAAQQAETIRAAARQEGAAQGRQEGLQEADRIVREQSEARARQLVDERLRSALPAVSALAEELRRERDVWLAHWERIGVALAATIAEKLLRSELERRPELVVGRIAELLQLAAGSPSIVVRLNPVDLERLGDLSQHLARGLGAAEAPRIVPDERLAPGDCVVETEHGRLDARIDVQLERVTRELLGEVE